MQDITKQIDEFVAHCQKVVLDNEKRMGWSLEPTKIRIHTVGKRYVKLSRESPQVSVHAFIDLTNGDILMPATWKAPAKHARGNVTDKKTWTCAGPYGMAYLRR